MVVTTKHQPELRSFFQKQFLVFSTLVFAVNRNNIAEKETIYATSFNPLTIAKVT